MGWNRSRGLEHRAVGSKGMRALLLEGTSRSMMPFVLMPIRGLHARLSGEGLGVARRLGADRMGQPELRHCLRYGQAASSSVAPGGRF